ncbi:MAG: hypothetical protein KBT10_03320 [Bacteroidales bacterium]|nr:hypothetical protein [Candidatus Sodaliphilus aphodohippi]
MTKRLILPLLLFLLMTTAACSRGKVSHNLVSIDSMIGDSPDSAIVMLAAFPNDSLDYGDNRPYHALLSTIADYHAYQPITTDSVINIALKRYDCTDADPDKRMRSLLYSGCVAGELGNDTLAMRYYKLAQRYCPANDRFNQGYILLCIGQLYQTYFETNRSILHLKQAYDIFKSIGSTHYEMASCNTLGELYLYKVSDSAAFYINHTIKMASERADSSLWYAGRYNLAAYYYMCRGNYRAAVDIMVPTLEHGEQYIDTDGACYYLCMSLLELGKTDSAKLYLNRMNKPMTAVDSVCYLECEGELAKREGNRALGDRIINRSDAIADSITFNYIAGIMAQTELNMDAETQRMDADAQRLHDRRKQLGLILVITLLAAVAAYLIIKVKRKNWETDTLLADMRRLNTSLDHITTMLERSRQEQEDLVAQISDRSKVQDELSDVDIEAKKNLEQKTQHLQQVMTDCLDDYANVMKGLAQDRNNVVMTKVERLKKVMDKSFFDRLRACVNVRYDGLVRKLEQGGYGLKPFDINIICLELCGFPNVVIWTYSDVSSLHSVINKKRTIALKVGASTINDIPTLLSPKKGNE